MWNFNERRGEERSPAETELSRRCDEVLHYIWDPIGVAGVPRARDEYDSYLPEVLKLLEDGADEDQLVGYLARVETEQIGLPTNQARARNAAIALLDWYDVITKGP